MSAEVKVWDPLVRIGHWTLVAAFAIAWLTAEELDRVHEWAGYVVLGYVAVRLAWGFVGGRHARFADFVRGPGVVLGYLVDTARLRARRHLGHNPAGGAMILALLAGLAITGLTGFAMTTDAFWGVEWVEEVHEGAAEATLVLVVLHVLGVLVASLEHGENLVRAMVTGRKRALESSPEPATAAAERPATST
ncbi:MAG: cytochrome b/b6 domain-containing protein [Ectothiorhodospiraceae bacterium]|nr:cytochrome b/b6 domain-containing protein [Chromatiales bacterium]MCP5154462.1 cytochrome b/b6 domain-containing protein [Ectothiorhodospiraceae bacterium]